MSALDRIPIRKPTSSESDFFKKNPHVAGMAAKDHAVILNPFTKLNTQQQRLVENCI